MENERENSKPESYKALESRITGGHISSIISPELVNREMYIKIYSYVEKIEEKKFRKYFNFYGDGEDYWEEIGDCLEMSERSLELNGLNKGLNEEGLYIAHFIPDLRMHPCDSSDVRRKIWVYGCGDLYSDKDISVDEKGIFRELSLNSH